MRPKTTFSNAVGAEPSFSSGKAARALQFLKEIMILDHAYTHFPYATNHCSRNRKAALSRVFRAESACRACPTSADTSLRRGTRKATRSIVFRKENTCRARLFSPKTNDATTFYVQKRSV